MFVGFDLEIHRPVDRLEDWRIPAQFRVLCAVLEHQLWGPSYHWGVLVGGVPALAMTNMEVSSVWYALEGWARRGDKIVTWNGLAFDFPVLRANLAFAVSDREYARLVYHSHIDLLFEFYMRTGYRISLAQVLGRERKMTGINGAMAPVLWEEGRREDVLEYCRQDARVVVALACDLQAGEMLHYRRGEEKYVVSLEGLTVAHAAMAADPERVPLTGDRRLEWETERRRVLEVVDG